MNVMRIKALSGQKVAITIVGVSIKNYNFSSEEVGLMVERFLKDKPDKVEFDGSNLTTVAFLFALGGYDIKINLRDGKVHYGEVIENKEPLQYIVKHLLNGGTMEHVKTDLTYEIGDVIKYKGKRFMCVQIDHESVTYYRFIESELQHTYTWKNEIKVEK